MAYTSRPTYLILTFLSVIRVVVSEAMVFFFFFGGGGGKMGGWIVKGKGWGQKKRRPAIKKHGKNPKHGTTAMDQNNTLH